MAAPIAGRSQDRRASDLPEAQPVAPPVGGAAESVRPEGRLPEQTEIRPSPAPPTETPEDPPTQALAEQSVTEARPNSAPPASQGGQPSATGPQPRTEDPRSDENPTHVPSNQAGSGN